MDEARYDIPPGGASLRGAGYAWGAARAAQAPETPPWNPPPNIETEDPHADPSVGSGPPAVAAIPDNIEAGGDFAVTASYDTYTSADFGETPPNIVTD